MYNSSGELKSVSLSCNSKHIFRKISKFWATFILNLFLFDSVLFTFYQFAFIIPIYVT